MSSQLRIAVPRRLLVRQALGLAGGLGAGLGMSRRRAVAVGERLTASGGGVNLKLMPAADGDEPVPLRESFSFDAYYAQCMIEDNPARLLMDTFEMGPVVIESHTFFMAMYAHEVSLVSIRETNGQRVAKLTGDLGCLTEAGTASGRVGSRTASEPAFFEIEATDGGHGGGAAGDHFAFTVFFSPNQAPVNHAIFGPNPTFTGELIAGEITIAEPSTLPLLAATPVP